MDVVDFPDLEDTTSLETASIHLTQEILSNIKEKGEYMPPGVYLNLQLAFRMACLEVDRAQLQGVEEDNIDLLRKWADAVQDLITQSTPPPQPTTIQSPNAGTPNQLVAAQGNQIAATQPQSQG